MHVKVLLTYSATQPEANTVIAGGRNLSDTYYYPEKSDNSHYPELDQYGTFWYPFAYFDDLDFRIHDTEFTKTLARQMLEFMESDKKKMLFRQIFDDKSSLVPVPATAASQVSYQISAPYLDDRTLEKNFISLINSAKTRIRILSPYIRFTQGIFKAMMDAKARGVQVQIVTTFVIDGDLAPFLLKLSIRDSLNKIYKDFEIYRYLREPTGIMHAKALLIDDQVLMLGSVNLNRRSFAHDMEISFYFRGRQVIDDFNNLFEGRYLSVSQKMTEALPNPRLAKPLLLLLGDTM